MSEIVNRVANSGLIQINLSDYVNEDNIIELDLVDFLFQGLVVKEKEFRQKVKELETERFRGKDVGVYCSSDAIIQTWAYMLIISKLSGVANSICYGKKNKVIQNQVLNAIDRFDENDFFEGKIIVKGCSDYELSPDIYIKLTDKLTPWVSSVMFGEACSAVPVYKKKKP